LSKAIMPIMSLQAFLKNYKINKKVKKEAENKAKKEKTAQKFSETLDEIIENMKEEKQREKEFQELLFQMPRSGRRSQTTQISAIKIKPPTVTKMLKVANSQRLLYWLRSHNLLTYKQKLHVEAFGYQKYSTTYAQIDLYETVLENIRKVHQDVKNTHPEAWL